MARRCIKLKGQPQQSEEYSASVAITPGMLLEVESAGTVKPHSSADAAVAPIFALEREEMGKDIDTAYAIGDCVKSGHFGPGMRVNALIPSGQNLARGAYVQSNGNGMVKAIASGTRLGWVVEATGAVTETTRCIIELV